MQWAAWLARFRVDEIVWKRADDQPIRVGSWSLSDFDRRLTIRGVTSSDAGTYTCTAHYENHVDASDTGGPTKTHVHHLTATVRIELRVSGGKSTFRNVQMHSASGSILDFWRCRNLIYALSYLETYRCRRRCKNVFLLFSRSYCTRLDWLLPSYCCLTVCVSIRLSATLCIVAKRYTLQQKCLNRWTGSAVV